MENLSKEKIPLTFAPLDAYKSSFMHHSCDAICDGAFQ